jgi:hypothetical protein
VKGLLVLAGLAVLFIVTAVSYFVGGDDDSPVGGSTYQPSYQLRSSYQSPPAGWDASPAVWADIQVTSSCSSLQQMLSTAVDNNYLAREIGNSTAPSSDIISAVTTRMRAVGC